MEKGYPGSFGYLFTFCLCLPQSLLPELVVLLGVPAHSVWLQLLRVCRVLRSLKLFARFRQIKVILLALVRALKVM
jgi:cation channel sperm-associated protein 2